MIKKLILILCLFVTASFSQQLFKSEEYGFEITFPAYMVVKKGTSENPAVIAHINENTLLNIILQTDSAIAGRNIDDYNLDTFVTPLKDMLAKEMTGFKSINYGRTNVDGISSIYFAYNYNKSSDTIRAKQYFLINNSKMYGITTLCLETEAGDFEPVFNDCLNSFKFIK